jgi:hypothetical protein
MSFDLNYEYSKEINQTLRFNQEQWSRILTTNETKKELNSLIQGYSRIDLLSPYVSSLDNSTSSSFELRGSLLLFGKLEKSQTEQIRVISNGEIKLFYKYYGQSVKVIQNFFSRIFSSVIYKIFKFRPGISNSLIFKKKISLEYEANTPQSSNPDFNRVASSKDFSFDLTHQLETGKTDKWYSSLIKNNTLTFLDQYTYFPKEIELLIRKNQIKGPLIMESILRIDSFGFEYFIQQSRNDVWRNIAKICDSKKISKWSKKEERDHMIKKIQIGNESCTKKIGLKYESFSNDYEQNSMAPSLKLFKDFLTQYFKKSSSLHDLEALFSSEHTFSQGRIQAITHEGNSFFQVFSSGQFRGLGVIDNFKRDTGSRAPATIISE